MDINADEYGAIGQIDFQNPDNGKIDGGDSVNWEGHRNYLKDTVGLYISTKSNLITVTYKEFFRGSRLGYVRHPASAPTASYYHNPWSGNISRDQGLGILAYYIKNNACKNTRDYKESFKIILHHGAWLWLFAYNNVRNGDATFKWKWPDLTLFDVWAMEIRMIKPLAVILYPLLCVIDIHMLLSTLYFNRYVKDSDIISFGIKSIAQREHIPTPISMIAWWLLDKEKLKSLIYEYWCGWRSNCGMYLLYEDKIDKLNNKGKK